MWSNRNASSSCEQAFPLDERHGGASQVRVRAPLARRRVRREIMVVVVVVVMALAVSEHFAEALERASLPFLASIDEPG